MASMRRWGPAPYPVVVVHGGPGAPGEVAPVARELSAVTGVLEPFQTETTLERQVRELQEIIAGECAAPVILIGFSYGAVLSWIVTSRSPDLVRKLILIGSPPFEDRYAASITGTRLGRLSNDERAAAQALIAQLDDMAQGNKDTVLAGLGSLLARADACEPVAFPEEAFHCQYDLFRVWHEVAELRRTQALLEMGRTIGCPVIAIHGDYDPHPAEGVNDPLSAVLRTFRFVLLKRCGHRPWIERLAAEPFYNLLVQEIRA